jgi:hypothetical protein
LDETYTLLLMNLGYKRTVDFHQKIEQMARAGILQVEIAAYEKAPTAV